jgi:thioredoxin-like negative regulator of GroEL
MKKTILVLLAFFLTSNLYAQGRRHDTWPSATSNDGLGSLDTNDPFAAIRSRAGSDSAAPASPAAGPVPVSQLRIPSKALKEFERSRKAFHSGDVPTSVEHLQRAVQIFPDFIQAHLALGLRFIQLGEYQRALIENETALSLDPRSAQAHQDLSFTLLLLNRNQEAEAEARQSLDLDSQAVAAHYVLGRAVIAQGRVTPEAMEMLSKSERAFPDASLVLAQIHFTIGRTDDAIVDLRHYLRAPSDADNKQKAECWVAQLSQQPLPAGCSAAQVTPPSFR